MSTYTFLIGKKNLTRQEFIDGFIDEVGEQIRQEINERESLHLPSYKQTLRLQNLHIEAANVYKGFKFWKDPLNEPVPGVEPKQVRQLPRFFK